MVHSRYMDDTVSNAPTDISLPEEDGLPLTLSDINLQSEAVVPKASSTGRVLHSS